MTAVHRLIEEAELRGARVVPLDWLRDAVTEDTTARMDAARAEAASIAEAVRKHNPWCTIHGRKGCTERDAMIAERDRIVDLITGSESLSA